MTYLTRVCFAALALWAAWTLTDRPAPTKAPASQAVQPRPIPSAEVYNGMAIQLYTGEDAWGRFSKLIPEIADLGADTVMLIVHAYQDHAGSMNFRMHATKTPGDADLIRLVDYAHQHGLRVMLMPIVLLEFPRGNEWRGKIKPPDLDKWFQKYTDFIVHYADIAERHDVEMMMVGSELVSLESGTPRWKRLIADVRQFYRGKLGYSANWDHYQTDKIEFWGDLDFVGMTNYYQLADEPGPTVDQVVAAWQRFKQQILDFHKEVNKPIIFTEIGWCSQRGAAREPWNYYLDQTGTPEGLAEQATCYEAFIKVWGNEPSIGGFIWWEWTEELGGPDNFNYTPKNKPAEKLLREWFASRRQTPTTRPAAS